MSYLCADRSLRQETFGIKIYHMYAAFNTNDRMQSILRSRMRDNYNFLLFRAVSQEQIRLDTQFWTQLKHWAEVMPFDIKPIITINSQSRLHKNNLFKLFLKI